ncbi:MAG TPA: hypothetical protein VF071_10140, partial [Candidatus Limnocylindria bacterium]
ELEEDEESEELVEESEYRNHGHCVREVAWSLEVGGLNENHGGAVSEAARVTCWETDEETEGESEAEAETESADTEDADASAGPGKSGQAHDRAPGKNKPEGKSNSGRGHGNGRGGR